MASSNEPHARRSPLSALYAAGLWSVMLTGASLYLFARTRMNPVVGALVGWHIAAGALLFLPFAWSSLRNLRSSTNRSGSRLFHLLGLLCGLAGWILIVYAASGISVGRAKSILLFHVISGMAILALGLWQAARWLLARRTTWLPGRLRLSTGTALGLLLLSGSALGAYTYAADSYYRALTATTPLQAGSPLFPAGTRSESGSDWKDRPTPESCGEAGCHPEVVAQWRRSVHAHGENSPFYRRALDYTIAIKGDEGARWCRGCHAPTAMLEATTDHGPQTTDMPNPIAASPRLRVPASSIDCLSCHAMASVPAPIGNGQATYAAPPVYPLADARQPLGRWLHGFLLRVRPEPHRAALAGPVGERVGERMCAPCHRLSVNLPQNHYKFLRYDDTWSDWQMSPYSGESVHTFALRPTRDCAACHMPPSAGRDVAGVLKDHRCPSGRGDAKAKDALRIEIFALRRKAVAQGDLEKLDAPLSDRPVVVSPGETVTVDVLVENRGIGHGFPSGLPDQHRAWIEFTAASADGKTLLQTADPPESAIRNPQSAIRNSHLYGLIALDRAGRPLDRGNLFDMVAPLYLHGADHGRIIQAGEGDVARYRFVVPANTGGALRLTARLLYRRFRPDFARWAVGDAEANRLPTITLAAHEVTLQVAGGPGTPAPTSVATRTDDSRDAPRFYAYGVALLLQSDYVRARRAFNQAISLAPSRADYHIGLARVFLATGDLISARNELLEARRLEPDSPRAQAWLGTTYRTMGQFDEALALLVPLAERFPRDRLLWFDIGLCHFRSGRYDAAANAFSRMLAVDPNDVAGHFNLMQCYQRLRRISQARQEEAIYRTLHDDEPSTGIADVYLRQHPESRLELLPMHEHVLTTR